MRRRDEPRRSAPDRPAGADRASHRRGLGGRLRAAREDAGISLRELARRIGVSASLISQIETDKVQPSVSTLYAIVTELRVSMDAVVFGAPHGGDEPDPERGADPGGRGGHVVVQRAGQHDGVAFRSGVRWESLAPTLVDGAEFLRVVYEPGSESSPAGTFHRHAGREWSVILEGTLHVSVAFDDYVLGPGDAISFDSTVPHRLANHGADPVVALWFQLGELPGPHGP